MKNNYHLTNSSKTGLLSLCRWLIVLAIGFVSSVSQAQTISGTVFRDFNSDGTRTTSTTLTEPGVGGIRVTAYNTSGAVSGSAISSTVTASLGQYTITVGNTNAYRVEFSNLQSSDFESFKGTGSGTSIQFTTGGTAGINLGISYPRDYCQPNPDLAVPCFVSGNPLATGSDVADDKAIVTVDFTASGTTPAPTAVATARQVGSVWGSAYQRNTKKLFSAAFLKRHSGLGTLGLGGIYVSTMTATPTSTTLVDLEAAPFSLSLGQNLLGTRPTIPASGLVSSSDPTAFTLVGKAGLGGMALSDDESKLYIMDLFNRQLLVLNIGNPVKSTFTAGDLQTITLPTPATCVSGVARPFAVRAYRGKVYIGMVCTAENSGTAANLRAYVYEMDQATNVVNTTPIFSTSLNYPKGDVHTGWPLGGLWLPWSDSFSSFATNSTSAFATRTARPQPILSDIAFTDEGDMVLGFMDRAGHQLGYRQRSPTDNGTTAQELFSGYIGGDILRVRLNGGTWVLENNGSIGTQPGSGVGNGQGPGGGEFYGEEDYPDNNSTAIHEETMQGGLVIMPGTNLLVATLMDPLNVFSGGFGWFNNTNGNSDRRYQIYISNDAGDVTLGKANGLGVITAVCDPAPIQIGNRVWQDTNNNGVQDAGEPPLAGVRVQLSGQGVPANTTVLTGTNGEYYFSNKSGTNTTGFVYSLTGLTTGSSYSLTFPTSASAGVFTLSTKPNTATGTNADAIDTDASTAGLITFTLGNSGENNYSFDVGFVACTTPTNLTVTATPNTVASGATVTLNASASGTTAGSTTYTWSGAGISTPTATTNASQTIAAPSAGGVYTYTVLISNGTTCTATATASVTVIPCNLNLTVSTPICNSITNSYTATGTVSMTNTPAGSLTITDNGTSVAVISVTAGQTSATFSISGVSNGSSHTVTVISSNAGCATVSRSYTAPASCTVCSTSITTASLPNGQVGTAYSQTLAATGGTSYTYTVSGSLPGGLSLSPTGVISGTPTSSGTASFTVRVTDAKSCSDVQPLTITIVCPTITLSPSSLPNAQVGTAYNQTLTATGGTASYTYTVSGNLPGGLSLSPTGVISGTPTGNGTSSFTVSVRDVYNCPAQLPLTITVAAAPPCSLTATATPGVCNTITNTYSVTGTIASTNAAVNGASPQTLTVSVGSVNTTVTLTGNGPVSYTLAGLNSDGLAKTVSVLSSAIACGSTSVTYTAPVACTVGITVVVATPVCNTLTNNYTATGTVSLTNAPAGTLTITDNGQPVATITVTAGQTSASFSVTGVSGSGPAAHTVVASLGTPTASTTYATPASCTVCSTSITTASLPNGQVGTAYSQTLTTSGGTAPLTYAVIGTLPAGLTLNAAAGVIAGIPISAVTSSFTVIVTDAKSCSDGQPLTISISALPVCSLTATATPGACNTTTNTYSVTGTVSSTNAVVNNASPQTLTVSVGNITTTFTLTGNGPVSYTLTGLNSDGLVKTVSVLSSATACGSASVTYTAPASCTVAPPAIAVVVASPVCNTLTNNYTATGTVSLSNAVASTLAITDNGTPVATISVTAGQTTASFSVSGISNASSHTVVATLMGGPSASTVYTAPVACTICSTSITTTSLPNGQVGTPYSQTLTASGGTAPYIYSVLGNLPPGLDLDPTGVISGTPILSVSASFSIQVTDAKSCSDVQPLTVTISALPVCSLTATATPGVCNTLTNTYTVIGTVLATNTVINSAATQSLTISVGTVTTTVLLTGDGPVSYTLSGLNSDGLAKTVSILSSATACGTTSVTYTAPASCTIAKASLGDYVWLDTNKDGVQDGTETGVANVTVVLCDAVTGAVISTTFTDGQGKYLFTNLDPASYVVKFTAPINTTFTTPLAGTSTATDSNVNSFTGSKGSTAPVSLSAGENNLTIDAGLIPLTAGLGDYVWEDMNANGLQDSGEPGIDGVRVTLLNSGTVVATTTTANGGAYSFNGLTPGIPYSVSFSAPTGFSATSQDSGNDALDSDGNPATGLTGAYSLTANEFNPTVDMGYYRPASLGDKVFADNNKNGVLDTGDTPIADAIVTLISNGTVVATTTTASSGTGIGCYSFTGLTPGVPYSVSFTTPAGYSSTTSNTGNDDTVDSDPVDGVTTSLTLASGEYNPTVDAGFIIPTAPAPQLLLAKLVSASKAKLGDVITYTVVLANAGPVAATNVVVNDIFSTGLSLLPGSVTVSVGSYTPGGSWSIATLPAGATATLSYSTSILAEGVHVNTASIPGQEAKVCTTVPYSVCKGTPYAIELTAPAGYTRYQWYLTNPTGTTLVSDVTATSANAATAGSYTITQAGEYKVVVDEGVVGSCPDMSCCPVIVEEVEVPQYTAMGKNPTCVGTTPQANGEITLMNLGADPTVYVYQVSTGTSFSAATALSANPVAVPANGLVATGLAGGNYTVRVWVLIEGVPSCPRDVTVALVANCDCPEEICVPVIIRKTKSITGR